MTPDTSHELDLETVFEAIGTDAEMEATAIQSMLEASGITAVLIGTSSIPTLPFKVGVPHDQLEQARKRIEEARAAGPAGAEEAEETAVEHGKGLISSTIPILASLNMDETIEFYKQLGFALVGRTGDDYGIVQRDGIELHFWGCTNKEVAENTSCYIRTPDAAALRGEFASSGVEPLSEVETKPWKMLEFNVTDPSGNLLRFGQPAGGQS